MKNLIKLSLLAILGIVSIAGCAKQKKDNCNKGTEGFDQCIHDKANVKFEDQEILDYFFSAKEGSWWAYKTNAIDPIYGTPVVIYDTIYLRSNNHLLEETLNYTREMYGTFYYFKNNFWTVNSNQEEINWNIYVTAEKNDIYNFEGSIEGQGRGMGSIYKYNNSYYTGHITFGWAEDEIYEYEKYTSLVVNGNTYYDVWSNYGVIGGYDPISRGNLVCYFAKNIGLIKMVNFHGRNGYESELIDYSIK